MEVLRYPEHNQEKVLKKAPKVRFEGEDVSFLNQGTSTGESDKSLCQNLFSRQDYFLGPLAFIFEVCLFVYLFRTPLAYLSRSYSSWGLVQCGQTGMEDEIGE